MVFELSDPDVVIELVVKRKKKADDADDSPSTTASSSNDKKRTSKKSAPKAKNTALSSAAQQERLDSKWTARYNELVSFKRQHGHTNVTPKMNRQLARWITYQRNDKFGRLTKERALKLHKLGVKLQNREEAWDERYNELVLYYRRHGNCLVPWKYSEAPHLRKFVNTQRQMIKVGTLRPDRVKLLDEIGFCRNARESRWDRSFADLKQFWEENGHCEVPQKYKEKPGLGDWVIQVCMFPWWFGSLFYT